jgi:hypothetical protein
LRGGVSKDEPPAPVAYPSRLAAKGVEHLRMTLSLLQQNECREDV